MVLTPCFTILDRRGTSKRFPIRWRLSRAFPAIKSSKQTRCRDVVLHFVSTQRRPPKRAFDRYGFYRPLMYVQTCLVSRRSPFLRPAAPITMATFPSVVKGRLDKRVCRLGRTWIENGSTQSFRPIDGTYENTAAAPVWAGPTRRDGAGRLPVVTVRLFIGAFTGADDTGRWWRCH